MRHLCKSIASVFAFFVLPLLTQPVAHAQSMPAGQVSHRMSTRPVSPSVALPPVTLPQSSVSSLRESYSAKLTLASKSPEAQQQQAADQSKKDAAALTKALGAANREYWQLIVNLDNGPAPDPQVTDFLRKLSDTPSPLFNDWMSQEEAHKALQAAIQTTTGDLSSIALEVGACGAPEPANASNASVAKKKTDCAIVSALRNLELKLDSYICWYSVAPPSSSTSAPANTSTTPKYQFEYPGHRWFLPLNGQGCSGDKDQKLDPIQSFFGVTGTTELASNAKYLYNAPLSTSQVNAQLLTETFSPGWIFLPFQAVFASTATAGSSQTNTAKTTTGAVRPRATSTAGSGTPTDSTSTAMAKLQAGGDFNLSFPAPWLYHATDRGSLSGYLTPNLGFNFNGFSGQNTITQATEYALNVPAEFYAQTYSHESTTNGLPSAVIFLDVRPSGELISSTLAKAISSDSSRFFFIGQAAIGIEFSQSFRISFQYEYSQKKIFQANSTGSSTSAPLQSANGFHLAVSFSPQSAKKTN